MRTCISCRRAPHADILITVVGDVDEEGGRLRPHVGVGRLDAAAPRVVGQEPVHDRRVRGVEPAFEGLQPIAFLDDLGDVAMGLGHLRPGEFRRRRHALGRPEIGPHDAAQLDRRIGGDVDLVLELLLRGLVQLIDAAAVDVELPAVIDAAQPAFLVAAEKQRGAPVRTILVQEPDLALGVAERDEVLAQQPDPHRRASGSAISRAAARESNMASWSGHRSIPFHPGDELVFLARQHHRSSWS